MKIFLILLVLMFSLSAHSEKNYIKGIQKVTFRTGPGTDSKILKMMETDTPVTLLEVGEEWTKVKDSEGKEGYILSRFLSKEVPGSVRYQWLKTKYEKLQNNHNELKLKNTELTKILKNTEADLNKTSTELTTAQTEYDNLKSGSAEYLKLQSNYKKTNALLDDRSSKVIALESQLSKHYIYWFLAGGGVLFLGWLIGLQSRKKKSSGQLSF
jgi:SH3 domain protein